MSAMGKMMQDDPKQADAIFSYLTGLKTVPFETQRFAEQKVYDENSALRDAIRKAKDDQKIDSKKKKAKTVSLADVLGGK